MLEDDAVVITDDKAIAMVLWVNGCVEIEPIVLHVDVLVLILLHVLIIQHTLLHQLYRHAQLILPIIPLEEPVNAITDLRYKELDA
jgi:hypothetical protein